MVITSKDNSKIKQLAKLYSNRKYRRETGLFVIEGIRGCVDALADSTLNGGNMEIEGIYYLEELFEGVCSGYKPELELLPEDKRFIITREIADKISDTDACQGIFVTAKMLDKPFSEDTLKRGGKYLILDELQDPGNLGTMIRTSDAVGLDGIVLTGNCVDLYNPKTVRSAVGSMPRVDIFVERDFERVIEGFKLKGIPTAAAVIDGGTEIRQYDFSKGCAVVIGNEGRGLTHDHAEMCSNKVTIAMHGHIDSLNAATAATIFLWEMTRAEG